MNRLLLVLATVTVTLSLVLLALLILLIFYRLRQVKNEKTIAYYIEVNQEDWISYLLGESVEMEKLKPTSIFEMEAIDELFFRLRYHFDSQELTSKINGFASIYLDEYYHKQLTSRNPGIRMNMLNKIYLFELTFLEAEVIERLKGKIYSKEEYLLQCKIIAKNALADFVPYFIRPALPLGEFDYKKLLVELEIPQIKRLAEEFDDLPEQLQLAIVDIVGSYYYLDWLPLMHHCLHSEVQELRIRALKSIASIQTADAYPVYREFASSSVWEERLMVAKIFRFAPEQQAEDVLNHLITDQTYQVRLQAAKSMKYLKNGQQALYSVITNSSDEFAVDLAEEMLGKE